jgi:hypothetical protein
VKSVKSASVAHLKQEAEEVVQQTCCEKVKKKA